MIFFSPAKVNLFLRVLGKRPDGYHELYTRMQAVDLFDELTIKVSHGQDTLSISDLSLPTDATNLILKATALFRQKTGLKSFFEVHCLKRIPHQAGFGGGSSNASTTLFACNQLTGSKISNDELQAWSAELGSDCPFFFSTGSALCKGRGERIENISLCSNEEFYICKPKESLSTAAVFKAYEGKSQQEDLDDLFINDLEKPAFSICSELENYKCALQVQFKDVVMSGSGTGFICRGGEGEGIAVRTIKRDEHDWYKPTSQDYHI